MEKITIDEVINKAKAVLIETGSHMPQLIVEDRENKIIMVVIADMPSHREEKEKLRLGVKNLIRMHGSKRYFVIMEAWMCTIKSGEKLFRMPNRDVDRIETLIVSEFAETKELTRMFPFRRETFHNKDKIIFEKEMASQTDTASMWNIWADEDKVNKLHNESVEKINDAFVRRVAKNLSDKHMKEFFAEETTEGKIKVFKKIIREARIKFDGQSKTILEDVTKDNDF